MYSVECKNSSWKVIFSKMFAIISIKNITFVLFTGEDQANSADPNGEGTQGTADFGGTGSDPNAPLIKQNIPG